MSELLATPPDAATDAAASTPSPSAVPYSLVGSYSTVQVLSPTTINEVEYATIQAQPSGVIASVPVSRLVFDKGEAGPELANFAQAIGTVMSDPRVIAGVGSQSIDDTGLLADYVVFTVQYIDPVRAPNGATALASVPVGVLLTTNATGANVFGQGPLGIIDAVFSNLKAAAGG